MFDELLKEKRNRFSLLEWAEHDGWLKDLEELPPYLISTLFFPDKEQLKKRVVFSDLIAEAIKTGDLPSKKVDAYTYNWLFNASEFLRSFNLNIYNPLNHLRAKQGKLTPPCLILMVSRKDFSAWLAKKGSFSPTPDSPITKWLEIKQIDRRKHERRNLQADSFLRICKKHGIPINSDGLYIINSKKWIKEIAKKEDPKLFVNGFDDFWKSAARNKIAINPHAARHRPKTQTGS